MEICKVFLLISMQVRLKKEKKKKEPFSFVALLSTGIYLVLTSRFIVADIGDTACFLCHNSIPRSHGPMFNFKPFRSSTHILLSVTQMDVCSLFFSLNTHTHTHTEIQTS